MKNTASILFTVASIGVLVAELFDSHWLLVLFKPLIMASMLFYYLFSSEIENRSRPLVLAIVFSFAGDVLLMKDEYFSTGLAAFLLVQIFYIFSYRQHRYDQTENALSGIHRIRLAFPIVLAGTGLVVILYRVLGDLKIPVMIYALALTLMVLHALFRYGRTSLTSFWMVFGGAVLFMISDSLIAIDKFLQPLNHAGFLILLTYVVAQYLIVQGLLKHPHQ